MSPTESAPTHVSESTTAELEMRGPPRPRLCGRCRGVFAGAATDDPSEPAAWWACPECHAKLFGNEIGRRRLADIAGVV
jgi:hypothetical protein